MNHTKRERIFFDLFHRNRRIQRLCYAHLGSAAEVDGLFQEVMTNVRNSRPLIAQLGARRRELEEMAC